jgi:hypothetical protein
MILGFIENKNFLLNLFKDIPQIEKFELCKLSFDREGPTAELSMIVNKIPEILPRKFQGQNFNASSLVMTLMPINSVILKSWETVNIGTFEVEKVDDVIKLQFLELETEKILFQLNCKFIDLKSWIPYLRETT